MKWQKKANILWTHQIYKIRLANSLVASPKKREKRKKEWKEKKKGTRVHSFSDYTQTCTQSDILLNK